MGSSLQISMATAKKPSTHFQQAENQYPNFFCVELPLSNGLHFFCLFFAFFFLVRVCFLSLFLPFPQVFPFLTDFSLVFISLPRFLLCFSWLYCSLTGCLRFSAGFSGFCSCSVNGFHRCHQEFHCKFPWLLLLAALFDGLRPLILFMRDLFALTRALFSLLLWPPKRIPFNKKCMESVFTEVMLPNKVHGYRL